MNDLFRKLFFMFGVASISLSCERSVELVVRPVFPVQLFSNTSFELDGSPSLSGWILNYPDSFYVSFPEIAAEGGGQYSLSLKPTVGQYLRVIQSAPAEIGTHIYRWSFWAKNYFGGRGLVWFGIKSPNSWKDLKRVSPRDTLWVQYSFVDTITANRGDSLFTSIGADYRGLVHVRAATYIDLCGLELLR